MLKNFTCTICRTVEQAAGGTVGFLCNRCKPSDHFTLQPQYLAHRAVAKARAAGVLADPALSQCADCTEQASEYDHREYAKPLQVQAVCRRCNLRRGPAIDRALCA